MAETLGSLVDKLSIKNLRLWHLEEIIDGGDVSGSELDVLQAKRDLVLGQRDELLREVDGFLAAAMEGKVKIRDEKVKLYNNPTASSAAGLANLGQAVSELAMRNIRLWHLEDEVRRTDLPDSEIVKLKREIDKRNQERNNFMDQVDEILWNQSSRKK